jgi:hypothetical protein
MPHAFASTHDRLWAVSIVSQINPKSKKFLIEQSESKYKTKNRVATILDHAWVACFADTEPTPVNSISRSNSPEFDAPAPSGEF